MNLFYVFGVVSNIHFSTTLEEYLCIDNYTNFYSILSIINKHFESP